MSTKLPTVIITGGTGGMGIATARLMGRDHRIVLADLDQTRLDNAVRELDMAGVEATGVVCDIADKASVEHLFSARSLTEVVFARWSTPLASVRKWVRLNASPA
ncbi:SDR family NAD(P)-dependent oxidoreductase [Glutamicibacter sp. AOP12-B1-11]|uniref:SDR family NAD(P)-dependent oxidoreductase n=1 Tax=Glutamicibacter sp. AOP12-B1-11 TaxID=3457725 RepID=UPI0040334000